MNRRLQFSHRSAAFSRRSGRGFTLIELMVAMLLGLIVIAGVSSVFLANMRSYHANTALGDVQSNARIAFELMARDIRQAGLTGCNSRSGRVANVLNTGPYGPDYDSSNPDWWANWNNAVHGYEDGTPQDPAVDKGTAEGQRVAGTDSLEVMGAVGSGLSVAESNNNGKTSAEFKLNKASEELQDGDIIMVCDPDHTAIVQVTSLKDSNVTVVHNTGSTVSPGNCSKGLGYPTPTGCGTGSANGNPYLFGKNSSVFKMAMHDWYIGVNPAGGKSLYRIQAAYSASANAIATTAQEMVRNVTNMQITYHQPGGASFVTADTSGINWGNVDAVRITYTLESADQRAGTDLQPLKRTFTATTTIRNRVN
ncbi:MAG TPA: prepilin-type N-terminal cleavage/methylation domain-containing protein [Oleiagrimonas sp.]|nr:prepilin-type N-terminal cleavage/methylation domain-containing protein [Oleiagrimonas sp.]